MEQDIEAHTIEATPSDEPPSSKLTRLKYPNYSNLDGSMINSKDGLSYRSRDHSRGGPPASSNPNFVNTAQSKTRKEYVDITDGSDNSDRNRKVHRIDLAQDDQEDI